MDVAFFFSSRRRHTRSDRDWSSDVCSSDLSGIAGAVEVRVPHFEALIAVDGALDEPVWNGAAVLTGFSEYAPADGRPAEDSTQGPVWYSATAIYFGVPAFETHGAVHASLAH